MNWPRIVFFAIVATGEASFAAFHIDMTEIARAGEGLGPSGWTLHAITNYTSKREAMKLAKADSYALSPVFGEPVVEASASVVSSSDARRRLRLIPCSADGAEMPGELVFDYSPTPSSFTNQTVRWPESQCVRRLRLAYDDGATTVWGIYDLDVRLASDSGTEDGGDDETEDDGETTGDDVMPTDGEIISLSDCRTNDGWIFSPDFSALSEVEAKTTVNGFVSSVMCHLRTGSAREESITPNEGTTQYQGHYVWMTNGVPSGLGTYTATQKNRSFGWIFHNDTGSTLALGSIDAMFGQWGARNAQPDRLQAEWRLSQTAFDIGDDRGWTADSACCFTAPFTNKAENAFFPVLEPRTFASLPETIPAGRFFAVRFVDTCPSAGYNAHLGIAALTVRCRRANVRPLMMIVR